MNVLVIAPHPDDEAIGCGGAILNHADAGDRVVVVVLTSGELGLKHLPREEAWRVREAESRAAATILGTAATHFLRLPDWGLGEVITEAAAAIRPLIAQELPRLIYLPHPQDDHPDHRACLSIVKAALGAARAHAVDLRAFEVWSPLGTVNLIEDVSAVIDRKLEAVRAYPSQLAQLPYDDAIQGLNRYRGVFSRQYRYAEAYSHPEM